MNRMTTETTTIRRATERDATEVAEIYNHYVGAGGATLETEHWSARQAAQYLGTVPPDIWLVAETDSAVMGWSSVRRYSWRGGYRNTCETAIYLAPAAWGTAWEIRCSNAWTTIADPTECTMWWHESLPIIGTAWRSTVATDLHSSVFNERLEISVIAGSTLRSCKRSTIEPAKP